MAYADIASMQESASLRRRLHAGAAEEGKPNVENWVAIRIWQIVGSPGWGAAWAYAVAAHPPVPDPDNPPHPYDPGADEGVITDGMILAVIQPMG
jgi:hypothetical protein